MEQAICHPDRPHRAKGMCKSCYSTHLSRLWRESHPGYESARKKSKGYKRPYDSQERFEKRLKEYGITLVEYSEMLLEQEGNCAICGTHMDTPCIDHDHETNFVRGLLCNKCNVGIGMFTDSVEHLQSAITYLDQAAFIKVLIGGKPVVLQKMSFKMSDTPNPVELN